VLQETLNNYYNRKNIRNQLIKKIESIELKKKHLTKFFTNRNKS
jgi:hypothetical protein